MTFNYKKYLEEQVEFYNEMIEFDNEQIEWTTKEIKEYRAADKKFYNDIWNQGVLTSFEMRHWGNGYTSDETRKAINERARWYRDRKNHREKKAYYEGQLKK